MEGLGKRLILLGAAWLAVLAAAGARYALIAGDSPFEAFDLALVTITTVGCSEIQPLGRAGRIINAFILLFSVMTMFFAIGAMTEFIVKAQLAEFFGKRRIKNRIDQLVDHDMVCGYGREAGESANCGARRLGSSSSTGTRPESSGPCVALCRLSPPTPSSARTTSPDSAGPGDPPALCFRVSRSDRLEQLVGTVALEALLPPLPAYSRIR